ncbi:phosphatidylserine decarboxylase family protein [Thermodesulfobacteriota bacterium]
MALQKQQQTKINNKWPVAREGLPFILTGLVLTLILISFGLIAPAVVMGILSLFSVYFFRDPERQTPGFENAVFTPADGKILQVKQLTDDLNPLGEPSMLVSIFMSVFSVHVNRVPVSGRVTDITYHPGHFFSAHLDKASSQNEKNQLTFETAGGHKIMAVQIAGLIARRIVCWVKKGDEVAAGQRFGLIRFGSRLDVYFPKEAQIIVQPRDLVKAGETILGYLS